MICHFAGERSMNKAFMIFTKALLGQLGGHVLVGEGHLPFRLDHFMDRKESGSGPFVRLDFSVLAVTGIRFIFL